MATLALIAGLYVGFGLGCTACAFAITFSDRFHDDLQS